MVSHEQVTTADGLQSSRRYGGWFVVIPVVR